MKFMWIVFALLAALTAGIVVVLSKAGMKNMDSSLVFAIQSVLILIVSWSVVFCQGNFAGITKIDNRTWIFLVTAGILTCTSSLLSFRALKLGEASMVSPVQQLSFVFAIILALIFLKERVSWQVIAGAALMVAGAIIIALSKKAS